jgi:ribosomal protein S20
MAPRAQRFFGLAAMAITAVLLAGCATATDLSESTAAALQGAVRTVAEQAASQDYTAAVTSLESLQSQLDKDIASGLVSGDRGTRIQAAIALVRADLGTRAAPTPTVTPTPTPSSKPGKGNGKAPGRHK